MSTIYNIIAGYSNTYCAVWADPNSNINSGRFYISTTGSGASLSIIDSQYNTLIDNYTLEHVGNERESLYDENIVDININILGVQ